jgi:hypothetical protein
MNKKLMLLAAGVLSALAFAALPAVASAGEFTATCGAGATCAGTIEGTGNTQFTDTTGLAVTCTQTTGTTSQTSGSPTGSAQFLFHGCSAIPGECHSTGQPAGTITTNAMVTHLIYIDPNKTTPGVLLTSANVTFTCPGVFPITKTVTGNIIGHITNPECGVARTNHTTTFSKTGAGQQTFKQVTTTGTIFDLVSTNDAGGNNLTSAQTGEGHITYTGTTVKFNC